jgi:[ribosomal protein S5]-alanine N-acetyltransferase
MSDIKLETPRLRLREIGDADAAFLLELLNEPAFIRNIGDRGVRTVAEAATYIHDRFTTAYERYGFGTWMVELKSSGEPVGTCGLIKRDTLGDIDLGFAFFERHWSRGFGFESTSAVMDYGWKVAKLSRLIAVVASHNTPSIRLLEKLGFSYEKMVRLKPEDPELMLFAIAASTTYGEAAGSSASLRGRRAVESGSK